jgi:hypothetical protein
MAAVAAVNRDYQLQHTEQEVSVSLVTKYITMVSTLEKMTPLMVACLYGYVARTCNNTNNTKNYTCTGGTGSCSIAHTTINLNVKLSRVNTIARRGPGARLATDGAHFAYVRMQVCGVAFVYIQVCVCV